jgi:RNA polymerase sigma-70 factor (ECF subfamily)
VIGTPLGGNALGVREAALTVGEADAPPAIEADGRDRLVALVRAHFDSVGRLLRALGVREADVDDAAQQVFVVLSRRIAGVTPGTERGFLYRTAVNVAAHARRAIARSRESVEEEPTACSAEALPDELLDQRRARECLDRILETMPLDLRTVFVLYEIEELQVPDIAALLEIPLGTAASRLRRAREDFQQRVHRWRAGSRLRTGEGRWP